MSAPLDVTGRTDEAAITALVTFGETVTTPAGTITPAADGFTLSTTGARRPKHYETAAPAVRALRSLQGKAAA